MKKLFAIALALMLCIGALSVCAFAAEDTITVYVKIDSETAPYVHFWGAGSCTWPGVQTAKDGEYWSVEVPAGVTGLVINNGDGTQTNPDILGFDGSKDIYVEVAADYSSYEVSQNGGTVETPTFNPDGPFYVAGSAGLCGAKWDAAAEANKMTKGEDGIWTITYSDVAAGSYSLKVTDGSWSFSWGGNGENGNFDITVEDGAEVVVMFDPAAENVDVSVNGELVPETGDMGLTAIAVALVAASAGLVCTLTKKKEF